MRDPAGPEQVRRWWRRWPEANVGVVTGAVSGLVVLSIDSGRSILGGSTLTPLAWRPLDSGSCALSDHGRDSSHTP